MRKDNLLIDMLPVANPSGKGVTVSLSTQTGDTDTEWRFRNEANGQKFIDKVVALL